MAVSESDPTQQAFYEREWEHITLGDMPGKSGWRTLVPAHDFVDFVEDLKKEVPTGRVLDLGCGGGRHAILLAQNGYQVSAVDFAAAAITQAKAGAEAAGVSSVIDFTVGDALALPYAADYFDVVNDDGCLHHIDPRDWNTYVQGIARVLKSSGILRVKAFSKHCAYYEQHLKPDSSSQWLHLAGSGYTYFFSKDDIQELFADRFEVIKLEENLHTQTDDKRFFFGVFKKL